MILKYQVYVTRLFQNTHIKYLLIGKKRQERIAVLVKNCV